MENIENPNNAENASINNVSAENKPLDFEEFRIAKAKAEIAERFPGYGEAVSAGVEKAMKKGIPEADIKEQIDIEYNKDGLNVEHD